MSGEMQSFDRVVIGGGFLGTAAGAYAASELEQQVLVLDAATPEDFRVHSASKGGRRDLRGARIAEQPDDLVQYAIEPTYDWIAHLQDKHGVPLFREAQDGIAPYLMVMFDQEHLEGMTQSLPEGSYHTYSVDEARARFGMRFPDNAVGVVDIGVEYEGGRRAAHRISIDDLDAVELKEITDHHGERRLGTRPVAYHKDTDGYHVLSLSDGTVVRTRELVVAAGPNTAHTLTELRQWHADAWREGGESIAEPEGNIRGRLREERHFEAHQQVLRVRAPLPALMPGMDGYEDGALPEGHIRPATVYFLNANPGLSHGEAKKGENYLGVYIFPIVMQEDGQDVLYFKIGYDPRRSTQPDPEQDAAQLALVRRYLSGLFGIPESALELSEPTHCAYPVSDGFYPMVGDCGFNGIQVACSASGYGAMTRMMVRYLFQPDEHVPPLFRTDLEPDAKMRDFTATYGPGAPMLQDITPAWPVRTQQAAPLRDTFETMTLTDGAALAA